MHLWAQASRLRGLEHAPRFLERERVLVDEDVRELRETLFDDPRDHLFDDRVDVPCTGARGIARVGRQRVRAEKGRRESQGRGPGGCSRRAQELDLGLGVQTVAALDFHRRRTEPHHAPETRSCIVNELVLARAASCGHRAEDAAPCRGDLRVCGA